MTFMEILPIYYYNEDGFDLFDLITTKNNEPILFSQ